MAKRGSRTTSTRGRLTQRYRILKTPGFDEWVPGLGQARSNGQATRDRTVLEKHLTQYTARNTFDYFIHKDLGGFLRRELDFYIKNEVMHLDDIENESCPKVEQYLSKIKVIRSIAHKIIAVPCTTGGLPEEALAEEEVRRRDQLLHHPRPDARRPLPGDRRQRRPARGMGAAVCH